MESSRRAFLNDMAEHRPILRNNQNTHHSLIIRDTPMFSHINGKLSPRPFEWWLNIDLSWEITKIRIFRLFFKIDLCSATSMESSRWDLLNDMAEHRPILSLYCYGCVLFWRFRWSILNSNNTVSYCVESSKLEIFPQQTLCLLN